jgi:exonuclease SbcC
MRLNKLTLKNIRSYKDQEIVFPKGNLLLAGDVGSGKTSILLALEYALFGLQPGQRGSALLRGSEETGEVTLSMEAAGKEIVIERRLKRSTKSVSNEYAAITIDGEKFELSISEIKTKIIKLLNYPDEFIKKNNIIYRYTVYTPQEQMKQIILEDKETRLNILRHVFGIDKYKRMQENLSMYIQNLKGQIKKMEGQIISLEMDKENLKDFNEKTDLLSKKEVTLGRILDEKIEERKLSEFELMELEEKRKDKENLLREIEKTKILQSSKQESLFSIIKEIREIEDLLSNNTKSFNQSELDQIKDELNKNKASLSKIQSHYHTLEAQKTTSDQRSKEELQKKERVFKIDICPTCLQDVSENHKHNILNDVEKTLTHIKNQEISFESNQQALISEIDSHNNKIKILESQRLELEVLRSKQEDITRAKEKLTVLKSLSESTQKDYNFLEKHLSDLKANILKFSTFDIVWKNKQSSLQDASLTEKKAEITLAESRKEQQLMELQKSNLEKSIIETEKIKTTLLERTELNEWLSDKILNLLSHMEHQVLLKLRKEFSQLFRKWFQMLAGESFDAQLDESFTPIIIQGGIEMDYQFLSGGERTATALAYRLALNQMINSVLSNIKTKDVIILDEPTDGFSSTQITKMRDIFEELDIAQLIIVSHESQIESFVDNIIRLKKETDESQIEEESTDNLLESPQGLNNISSSP